MLASGQLSYIISPEFSVSGKREIQFTYYDNTPGIVIKGCLTTETEKCKIIAQGNLNETNWRLGSYTIPPNTKKVFNFNAILYILLYFFLHYLIFSLGFWLTIRVQIQVQ